MISTLKKLMRSGVFLTGIVMFNVSLMFVGGPATAESATSVKRTTEFSEKQAKLLALAHKYGSKIGYPETMQAILLQESNAGNAALIGDINNRTGERSYGRMQVKVAAAQHVFKYFPEVRHKYFGNQREILGEEIIILLMNNDEANIHIASKLFEAHLKDMGNNWYGAVTAYNTGLGGARQIRHHSEFGYVKDISRRIEKQVRPFNKELGLVVVLEEHGKKVAAPAVRVANK